MQLTYILFVDFRMFNFISWFSQNATLYEDNYRLSELLRRKFNASISAFLPMSLNWHDSDTRITRRMSQTSIEKPYSCVLSFLQAWGGKVLLQSLQTDCLLIGRELTTCDRVDALWANLWNYICEWPTRMALLKNRAFVWIVCGHCALHCAKEKTCFGCCCIVCYLETRT